MTDNRSMDDRIAAALGPSGGLAHVLPDFEDRPAQRQVSNAVAAALANERTLLVEAGTGTGKSLGYLVPALQSGLRIVIATSTRALQDQLALRDVPLAQSIVASDAAVAVLKGLGAYVCKRRLASAELGEPMRRWTLTTTTGDQREAPVDALADDTWRHIAASSETRVGPRCAYFDQCFVTRARRDAERARLLIVNHHLYAADLKLRESAVDAGILPAHDAVIIDEAHGFGDVLTDVSGLVIDEGSFGRLATEAARMPPRAAGTNELAALATRAATQFGELLRALGATSAGGERIRLDIQRLEDRAPQAAWFAVDNSLADIESQLGEAIDESNATALFRMSQRLRTGLAAFATLGGNHVAWLDPARRALVASPLFPVAAITQLRRHVRSAIFTSGTLTTQGSFAYMRQQLGLPRHPRASIARMTYVAAAQNVDDDEGYDLNMRDDAPRAARPSREDNHRDTNFVDDRHNDGDTVDELRVPSPFDFRNQAIVFVPRDLPPSETLTPPALALVRELLALYDGHAFLLFTSRRALRDAALQLADAPYPLCVQDEAPRHQLVERFRSTPRAVLLGTATFWEGIDVPGDALRLVIIDRLPFEPPTDPLLVARAEAIAHRGASPFDELQLPAAALTLRQGFGRLIRRRDDRGVVAVLDSRLVTKRYAEAFWSTLPEGVTRTSSIEQVRRWVKDAAPAAPTQ